MDRSEQLTTSENELSVTTRDAFPEAPIPTVQTHLAVRLPTSAQQPATELSPSASREESPSPDSSVWAARARSSSIQLNRDQSWELPQPSPLDLPDDVPLDFVIEQPATSDNGLSVTTRDTPPEAPISTAQTQLAVRLPTSAQQPATELPPSASHEESPSSGPSASAAPPRSRSGSIQLNRDQSRELLQPSPLELPGDVPQQAILSLDKISDGELHLMEREKLKIFPDFAIEQPATPENELSVTAGDTPLEAPISTVQTRLAATSAQQPATELSPRAPREESPGPGSSVAAAPPRPRSDSLLLNRAQSRELPRPFPLDLPEFYRSAPDDVLQQAISTIDKISNNELHPIEQAKLKALLDFAIDQNSLANEINASDVHNLRSMLGQLESGIDRLMTRQTKGSQPSSRASSHLSSQSESSLQNSAAPSSFRYRRKPKRPHQEKFREGLRYRDSERCAISRRAGSGAVIRAAHILPLSVHPPDDPCWGMLRLFLGNSFSLLHECYSGGGINRLDNGWMLHNDLEAAFADGSCCFEPVTDPDDLLVVPPTNSDSGIVSSVARQVSYKFLWLEAPEENQRYGAKHPTRPEAIITSGDLITLCTPDTIKYPLPNHYLLMIHAAIMKLNKEFKALADVFPDVHQSDDEESICDFDDNSWEQLYWDRGYEYKGYWSRVKSWLDEWPDDFEQEGVVSPSSCGPIDGRFDRRFSSEIRTL